MSVVMPRTFRATPDNSALLRVLEAVIETLKAENEILKRRLAIAETRAAQAAITERLDACGRARQAVVAPAAGLTAREVIQGD
jgi:hypothetical protein